MARPQQPELARSGKTDIDPDHVETGLEGLPAPVTGGETGPVPPDNQPGHHPPKEQDKPDLDAFAAKLGTDPTAPSATKARKPSRPKATPAKPSAAKAPAAADLGPLPDAAGISAPQPEPANEREPLVVGLALLPLRETVKRLEQLERRLTERLMQRKRSA
ncbi:MAG: hypothetical protein QOE13_3149 [Gaiellaceae bacterium]|jgi:hypothetical protein|nr:hypothetical protein [Gaiellaceae bacterium]